MVQLRDRGCPLPIRIAPDSGSSHLTTLEEMAETKKEERVLPTCAVHANKVPKELLKASVGSTRQGGGRAHHVEV